MAWNSKAKFNKSGCPCVADCEKRCVGCRSTCEPFKEYEAKRIRRDNSRRAYDHSHECDKVFTSSVPWTIGKKRTIESTRGINEKRARGYMI